MCVCVAGGWGGWREREGSPFYGYWKETDFNKPSIRYGSANILTCTTSPKFPPLTGGPAGPEE